jgi:type IX secretion system substrate protein
MKSIFLLLFVFITPIQANAQWRYIGHGDINGDEGGVDQAFGVHDSSFFVGYGGHGIWRYTSGSWSVVNTGLDLTQGNVTSFASIGSYLFASPGLRAQEYTIDNGSHWNNGNAAGPVASNGKYLFGEYPYMTNIARSRDTGRTWDSVAHLVASSFATNGACVFATSSNSIYRSTDSGNNWAKTTPPSGLSLSAFAVIDTQMFAGGTGVFRSVDSGQNWTQISIPNIIVNALAASRGYLFAGADTGVFVSSDSGKSWKNVSQGMGVRPGNPIDVTLLAVMDTMLFAEVYGGTDASNNQYGYATVRPISEMTKDTTASVVQATQPTTGMLAVYPNPLTQSTKISFTSPESGAAEVTIVNLLGGEVARLFDGEMAAGEHSFEWDASAAAAGTYFCIVHTSVGVQRVAMVVEK